MKKVEEWIRECVGGSALFVIVIRFSVVSGGSCLVKMYPDL